MRPPGAEHVVFLSLVSYMKRAATLLTQCLAPLHMGKNCKCLLTLVLARRRREVAAEAAAGAAHAELEGLRSLVESLQAQLKLAR